MGRRRRGAVRATFVLAAATAAVLVLSGSEEWVATPLPDGTTMYLRYGTPGGVRIVRGRPAEVAAPDSVSVFDGGEPRRGAPTVSAGRARAGRARGLGRIPRRADTADPRRGTRRASGLPRAPRLRSCDPRPRRARTPSRPRWPFAGAPDYARGPAGASACPPRQRCDPARPRVATSPPGPMPVPPESPVAGLAPEPRTVREAFASDGLFTTQLLLFETGKSELLPFSQDILRVVAGVLREFPEARIRVEGYTDRRGRADVNLALSQRRAEAVRDFLAGEGGLGPDRVEAVGYGEQNPVVEGSTPTALALNRRVQIRVLNPEALRRSVRDR